MDQCFPAVWRSRDVGCASQGRGCTFIDIVSEKEDGVLCYLHRKACEFLTERLRFYDLGWESGIQGEEEGANDGKPEAGEAACGWGIQSLGIALQVQILYDRAVLKCYFWDY